MTKTADDVLAEFEKKHGLKLGRPKPVTGLPTGNLAVDWQTGVGGLPRGRITELYGFEASGKTTTALQTAALLQADIIARQSPERIIYLDFEHALDGDYAEALGIDFEHQSFIPLQPDYLEQGAKAALDLIETGQVRMVIFDSVAAMSPKRKIEGEFDQATIQMHRAKLVSALCGTMAGLLSATDCAAVFVNHKMEGIELTGRPGLPPKVTTPGGRGLKFYASLRLEFDIVGQLKGSVDDLLTNEEVNALVGQKVNVKCVKNKVGRPGRTVQLRSVHGRGFDNTWQAVQVLMSRGLIKKTGAWFTINAAKLSTHDGQDQKFHGENALIECAQQHPEWGSQLITRAEQILAEQVETP